MSNKSLEPLWEQEFSACSSAMLQMQNIFILLHFLQCITWGDASAVFIQKASGWSLTNKKSHCCVLTYRGAASSPHHTRSLLNALRSGQEKLRLLVKIKSSTSDSFQSRWLAKSCVETCMYKICSINCLLRLRYLKENNKAKIKTGENILPHLLIQ